MNVRTKECKRPGCGGDLFLERYHGDTWQCLQCGQEEEQDIVLAPIPPPVRGRPSGSRAPYGGDRGAKTAGIMAVARACKDAVINDYQEMRLVEFYAQWHLTSRLWKILRNEWKVAKKNRQSYGPRKPQGPKLEVDPTTLPGYWLGYKQGTLDMGGKDGNTH